MHLDMLRNRQIIDLAWASEYECGQIVDLISTYLDTQGKDLFFIDANLTGTDKARIELMCLSPDDAVAAKLRFGGVDLGKLLHESVF